MLIAIIAAAGIGYAEYGDIVLGRKVEGMQKAGVKPVKGAMVRNIVTVDKQAMVREVAGIMDAENAGGILVVDKKNGEYVGIVTERDIVRKVVAKGCEAIESNRSTGVV